MSKSILVCVLAILLSWPAVSIVQAQALKGVFTTTTIPLKTTFNLEPHAGNPAFWSGARQLIGDIDGNGVIDLLFLKQSGDGKAFLVYSPNAPTQRYNQTFDLANVGGSVAGAVFAGLSGQGEAPFGFAGSPAGDFNGDGIDDFVLGMLGIDDNGADAGHGYVIYGKSGAARLSGSYSLVNVGTSGLPGVRFVGFEFDAFAGNDFSPAGDMNGDGVNDLWLGSFAANHPDRQSGQDDSGFFYLIYGKTGMAAWTGTHVLPDGTCGTGGIVTFVGAAEGDAAGCSLSGRVDVDGDGKNDLLVGADARWGIGAGQAYLIYGDGQNHSGKVFDLIDYTDRCAAMAPAVLDAARFDAIGTVDDAGRSVAIVGDANGDQNDTPDLLIGAWKANPKGFPLPGGEAYLIYGQGGMNRYEGDKDLATWALRFHPPSQVFDSKVRPRGTRLASVSGLQEM